MAQVNEIAKLPLSKEVASSQYATWEFLLSTIAGMKSGTPELQEISAFYKKMLDLGFTRLTKTYTIGGRVFGHPKLNYVIKVFDVRDLGYASWLQYAMKNQNNPIVPKVIGKPMIIGREIGLVRLKKLVEVPHSLDQSSPENDIYTLFDRELLWLLFQFVNDSSLTPLSAAVKWQEEHPLEYRKIKGLVGPYSLVSVARMMSKITVNGKKSIYHDLNRSNWMIDDQTGLPVLIDPLARTDRFPRGNYDRTDYTWNVPKRLSLVEIAGADGIRSVAKHATSYSEGDPVSQFLSTDFKHLGSGQIGSAFARDDDNFVIKVWDARDVGFTAWINFCIDNQDNPLIPAIKGRPVKFYSKENGANYLAVRIERLSRGQGSQIDVQTGIYQAVMFAIQQFRINSKMSFKELIEAAYREDAPELITMVNRFGAKHVYKIIGLINYFYKKGIANPDLHGGNVLFDSKGKPKITDPLGVNSRYQGSKPNLPLNLLKYMTHTRSNRDVSR